MFLKLCRRKFKNHKITETEVTSAKNKKRKFKEKLNAQVMF